MVEAFQKMVDSGVIESIPVKDSVAAISVGKVEGEVLLDLSYEEDSKAEVDMNVVMTGDGRLIEIQGTAEREPFSREQLDAMLSAAVAAGRKILKAQRQWTGGKGR